MKAQIYGICEQVLSGTGNAVYQGIIIVVLTAVTMRLLKRANAATRHAILFTLLLLVAALVPAHLAVALRPGLKKQVVLPAAPKVATPEPVALDQIAVATESGSGGEVEYAGPAEIAIDPALMISPAAGVVPEARPLVTRVKIPKDIRLPSFLAMGLIGGWILLSGIRGARMVWRLREIRHTKKFSAPPSLKLQQLFDQLSAELSSPRAVRVRVSTFHRTPMALGFARPVVLIPAEMDREGEWLDDAEIEHVIRHELAHIERRDDWGNLTQQAIEAALFFHPAIWWISPRLTLEREIACDDHVLEASGRPRSYALTLANAASRLAGRRLSLAPGVSGNSSQLQQRISMILNTHRDRSSRLAKRWLGLFATAAAALAALAILAGPRLVLAQTPPPAPNPPATPESADGAPAALPGSSSESGPRSKPGADSDIVAPVPPVPEAAEAPEPPEPPEPAEPAEVAVVASTGSLPTLAFVDTDDSKDAENDNDNKDDGKHDGAHKGHHDNKDMSVEDRLDRIERILAQLQGRDHVKMLRIRPDVSVTPNVSVQPRIAFNNDWAAAQAKMAEAQVKMATEQAQMAADQGKRAAEQASRAAEQAMREMKAQGRDALKGQAEGLRIQLDGLRQARESLQDQLHNLEGQIQELEQKRNHLRDGKGEADDASGR